MRLSWIYLSEKVQTFCRALMRRFNRGIWRNKPDGMFIHAQIHRTERCVVCKIDTGVPVHLDISRRLYYIEGVGQFCHDCFDYPYTGE